MFGKKNELQVQVEQLPDIFEDNGLALVEIEDDKVINRIISAVPQLAQAGVNVGAVAEGMQLANQGVYQAILPAGAKLVNSKDMEGAVRGFFRNKKGIAGQANWMNADSAVNKIAAANIANAAMGAAALVVGQYYMKQINDELADMNSNISKLANFQMAEYKGKVLTLMTQVKRASEFQAEILEDNNLRNEEIQRLQGLETTCMDLLNQANVTISELSSKEGESFEKYDKLMSEVAIWQKYQGALTEVLYMIADLNYTLHLGAISKEQCYAAYSDMYAMENNLIDKLRKWHEFHKKKFKIDVDQARMERQGREAVDGRYGKDANRVLRAIDSAEKDCGIRLLEADPKAEGVIGTRVLPKGWVARRPSDIYWNGIRTFGIFCDYGLSIPEYVSLAVKLKEQKSVSLLGNRNDDAEENDKDDSDAGDIGNIRFWNLPIYHDDWRDNLTIELTQEEAFYLDKQIQKSTKGSLLEYVLKNNIDLNEYDDFASLTAELSEKVSEKLAYMMKLACDFNNLVYMARVRYNVMLSEGENTYANDKWSRLLLDIRHNATVNLGAVFEELQLINPRAKSFLCGIQAAFMASDIDMADELIRKRERSLKGAARAKLSRTKEFDHSKWVGGGILDYRFSNARRIVNDIYAGEVNADV